MSRAPGKSHRQSVAEMFSDCDEGNDVDSRTERRKLVNRFRNRMNEWLTGLDARGPGPSAKEMRMIIGDIEDHLKEMRKHG
ncbi:MAG: hypothetical protein OXI71_14040 [Gemmatimonadota bacterium]|nr:hypothetical protein [Gemmatimonadota bacterium]